MSIETGKQLSDHLGSSETVVPDQDSEIVFAQVLAGSYRRLVSVATKYTPVIEGDPAVGPDDLVQISLEGLIRMIGKKANEPDGSRRQ